MGTDVANREYARDAGSIGRIPGRPIVVVPGEDKATIVEFDTAIQPVGVWDRADHQKQAANAGKNLKKSVMELGGSDVFVVLDDADMDKAVAAGVEARLRGCGQVCNGAKRFLIHEKVADEFTKKLADKFTNTKIGDPMDESVGLGPMSSIGARDDIAGQVERAVKAGAKVLVGGSAIDGPGAYYKPTILTNVSRDNPAYFEEFFGPVAQVHVIKNDDDVVRIANDSNFGLSGAISTADVERAKSLASQVETGSTRYLSSGCFSRT